MFTVHLKTFFLLFNFFQSHFQGVNKTTGEVPSDVGRFDTKITFPLQNALDHYTLIVLKILKPLSAVLINTPGSW